MPAFPAQSDQALLFVQAATPIRPVQRALLWGRRRPETTGGSKLIAPSRFDIERACIGWVPVRTPRAPVLTESLE